ncbi:MAG: hypothetical protein ACRBC3_19055 [Burkholderiaceae bacterium]
MPFQSEAVASRLGIDHGTICVVLDELEASGYIERQGGLIWLHEYVETQLGNKPASSPPWINNTIDALGALPDSDLVTRYKSHYEIPNERVAMPPRKGGK